MNEIPHNDLPSMRVADILTVEDTEEENLVQEFSLCRVAFNFVNCMRQETVTEWRLQSHGIPEFCRAKKWTKKAKQKVCILGQRPDIHTKI
jgi:hypothetical protein